MISASADNVFCRDRSSASVEVAYLDECNFYDTLPMTNPSVRQGAFNDSLNKVTSNGFIEQEDFWEKYKNKDQTLKGRIVLSVGFARCKIPLESCFSEQLVYKLIKHNLTNDNFSIKSKYLNLSTVRVNIVKVTNSLSSTYYLIRRNKDCKIVVDQIIPSYRKTNQVFLTNITDIYKKPKKHTINTFLQTFNTVRLFKED